MLYCENLFVDDSRVYNILIVEDSDTINKLVYTVMSKKNCYAIDQSFDFADASQKLSQNSYDFIILDLNLPDKYGEDLVSSIKALTKAKIIILTAEADKQIRESLFKSGILDYIVKDNNFMKSVSHIDQVIHSIAKNHTNNILLIEDSAFMNQQLQKILSVRNYNSLPAFSAAEALEILSLKKINLIILDMELPDMHGLEFLNIIREKHEFCHVPVIVISGDSDPETVRESLKGGASDYIKKPFNIEEFTLKIDLSIELNRAQTELLCKQKILDEYKSALDDSTIVSKTDVRGIITYVNNKFCEISGYNKDELIGKNHNLVRHPDMNSSLFEEMWETIKNKKSWSGIVKNRKKDGSSYYVQSTISPIEDYNGNIVEYIGIRTDITELEIIKEELENNLNISNKNFSEAYRISQEYQRAIDESNILSRTDINGIITYVNDKFCKTSKYSKDELMGKKHSIIKDPKTPKHIYRDMWNSITSKKVWHGLLKNRAKDGSTYYVESTIVPILDENDNIVEYLGIRHEVTDIVNLHKELETTQKEIIYKMGEIGESRSKETGYHVKRVAEYSRLLARLAGLGEKNANLLYLASPMHDIGKVAIADHILMKPSKLNEEEWKIMQTHSKIGYDVLKHSSRPMLKAAAIVSYRHHEKWDGTGYPNGIAGEDIHVFGRITAIADVFDALGSDRVYKKAWELEQIIEYFKDQRAKHFDPNLIDIFLDNLDKFLYIREKFKDI